MKPRFQLYDLVEKLGRFAECLFKLRLRFIEGYVLVVLLVDDYIICLCFLGFFWDFLSFSNFQ